MTTDQIIDDRSDEWDDDTGENEIKIVKADRLCGSDDTEPVFLFHRKC